MNSTLTSARRFPSASHFFDALLWTLGHHSSLRIVCEDDKLLEDHDFPAEFIETLEARSATLNGSVKNRGSRRVKITKFNVVRPYWPISKSDGLCRQILVVGGLLKMAGVDKIAFLPRTWRLDSAKPKGEKVGLFRIVGFAFRNQRLGYCNSRPELTYQPMTWKEGQVPADPRIVKHGDVEHVDPAFVRELHRSNSPLFKSLRPVAGYWMLTEQGSAAAQALLDERGVPGYSLTAQWMDANVGHAELEKLYTDLSRRLPRSFQLDKIRGHVHNKLLKLVELDSFAPLFARGEEPSLTQVGHFCFRQAVSDLVADGREPACRALHGALTPRERGGEHIVLGAETVGQPVYNTNDDDDGGSIGPMLDVADTTGFGISVMERDAMRHGINEIESAIRAFKPKAGDRYVRVFHKMHEGTSITELGELEGVEYDRASTLMNETRNAARKARMCGQIGVRVLEYVIEEPYSTADDLWNDLNLDRLGKIPGVKRQDQVTTRRDLLNTAMQYLVRQGRLEIGADGACLATPSARSWLATMGDGDEKLLLAY